MIKVVAEKCPQNHLCPMVKICPVLAIKQEGVKAPIIDHSLCIGCNRCVLKCPYKAFVKVEE